jgi:hypothetical protein
MKLSNTIGLPPLELTGRAREIPVPPDARALSVLPRVDYEDATVIDTELAHEFTAEQWARTLLEDAPANMRRALRSGWAALGLKHGSTDDDRRILGWEVGRKSDDFVLLVGSSRVGMPGEVLVKRKRGALLVATFLQFENPVARAAWAPIGPGHRQIVRHLLEQGVDRVEHAGREGAEAA